MHNGEKPPGAALNGCRICYINEVDKAVTKGNFMEKRAPRSVRPGFTLIEVLIVLGILGMFMIVSYPSIMNTLATRDLDNATREIQTFLQQTKLQAVNARIAHRVHFYQPGGGAEWAYAMEILQEDGSWLRAQRAPAKTISTRYTVVFNLPVDGTSGDPVAIFSSLGMFPQYAVGQNSIALRSPKLRQKGQDDERVLTMYMGGAIQYLKRKST